MDAHEAPVGAITYATSVASNYVGANFSGVGMVLASGVVGGVSAELQGGSFEKGFFSRGDARGYGL